MPTDPQYAIVYTTFDGGYIKVGSCLSPDVTVGQKVLKVYDINPETGELTEHGVPRPKVTVEQVREFVETYVGGPNLWGGFGRELLDFIDNGPEKPTAEQIAHNYVMLENIPLANAIVRGLREAGYLKDQA